MKRVRIDEARTPEDFATARLLFEAYEAAIGVDLCFQGFADELDNLAERLGRQRSGRIRARRPAVRLSGAGSRSRIGRPLLAPRGVPAADPADLAAVVDLVPAVPGRLDSHELAYSLDFADLAARVAGAIGAVFAVLYAISEDL